MQKMDGVCTVLAVQSDELQVRFKQERGRSSFHAYSLACFNSSKNMEMLCRLCKCINAKVESNPIFGYLDHWMAHNHGRHQIIWVSCCL